MSAPALDELPLASVLTAASPQARSIAELWWVFFWISAVVWVLVLVAAGLAVFRRRRGAAPAEPLVEAGAEPALVIVTGGAALATVFILFGLLLASISTGRGLAARPSAEALTIEITGQRWWWLVEYPANVPSDIVTTANEVHVPVGRPVTLSLESRDVIHSLWIPDLHGKRDLIPGSVTQLSFVAERPGVYRGQCAEFCGLQHAHMGLIVIAEPAERFEAWLMAERAPAASPTEPLQARGQQVFLTSSCPVCHGVRGTSAAGSTGPDLTHLASRARLAAATLPNTSEALGAWLRDPHDFKLGTLMPPAGLGPADLEPLLVYLESLR